MTAPLYATPQSALHYAPTSSAPSSSTYARLVRQGGAWRNRRDYERDTAADAAAANMPYATLASRTLVPERASASHSRLQSMAHECNELASLLASYYSSTSSRDTPTLRQRETDARSRQTASLPNTSRTPSERRNPAMALRRRRTLTAPLIIVDEDGVEAAARSVTQPSLDETGVRAAASPRRRRNGVPPPPPPRCDGEGDNDAMPHARGRSARQTQATATTTGTTTAITGSSSISHHTSDAGDKPRVEDSRAAAPTHALCEQMLQWLLFLFESREQQIGRIDRVESALLLQQGDFAQRCTDVAGLLRGLHRLASHLQSTPAARTATRCVEMSNLLSELVAAEDRLVADMLNSAASAAAETMARPQTESPTDSARYAALQRRYDAAIAENALLRRQAAARAPGRSAGDGGDSNDNAMASSASSDEDVDTPLPLSMTVVHPSTQMVDYDGGSSARRRDANDRLPLTLSGQDNHNVTVPQAQQLMAAQLENDTLRASIATLRETLVRHRAVIRVLSQSSSKPGRGAAGRRVAVGALLPRDEGDGAHDEGHSLGLIEDILAGYRCSGGRVAMRCTRCVRRNYRLSLKYPAVVSYNKLPWEVLNHETPALHMHLAPHYEQLLRLAAVTDVPNLVPAGHPHVLPAEQLRVLPGMTYLLPAHTVPEGFTAHTVTDPTALQYYGALHHTIAPIASVNLLTSDDLRLLCLMLCFGGSTTGTGAVAAVAPGSALQRVAAADTSANNGFALYHYFRPNRPAAELTRPLEKYYVHRHDMSGVVQQYASGRAWQPRLNAPPRSRGATVAPIAYNPPQSYLMGLAERLAVIPGNCFGRRSLMWGHWF